MDSNHLNNEIKWVIEKFKDLSSAYEEGKQAQKELNEFVALLQEETKLARDGERSAVFKKNRCQGFVNQQQEVTLKLLCVKEENEKLKCTVKMMEKTLTDIQNMSMSEHVKKDAEINKIKQDYLTELIKIQDAADKQVIKIKADQAAMMEDLRKTIDKKDETIDQQCNTISSLQAEVKELKERAEVNLDIYQKKLADQERQHQAEIETWKIAELNQTAYVQGHASNAMVLHRPGSDYPYAIHSNNAQLKHRPIHFEPHSRNIPPSVVQPITRGPINSLKKNSDFLSAHDFYFQNKKFVNENEEEKEITASERLIDNQNGLNRKPKVLVPNKKRKLFNSDQNLL